MEIPFVDLPRQSEIIEAEALHVIKQVYRSGKYILGPQLEALEGEVSDYLKTSNAIGLGSGTEALFLSLQALGIGPGDEVITTSFSFIAAAEMILAVGATPVFSEINPETYSMDPASLESLVNPKTKAVLVVHLFGAPADLNKIQAFCKNHDLFLIEDGCQAFGTNYEGKKVGTFGDMGCFSFYPTKILGGVGDGGMITTKNEALAMKLRALRHHGAQEGEGHQILGWNSRLDEIQAGVLRIKLKRLDSWIRERQSLAKLYQEGLQDTHIKTPNQAYGEDAIYQNYTIRSEKRDQIREVLSAEGIETMIYYPQPLYQIPAIRQQLIPPYPSLAKVEKVCEEVLSLPLYPGLTGAEVERVTQVLCDFEK